MGFFRRKPSSLREISEINMTPLMDLTFILLITFIITFPLVEQGVPINLPKGESQELDANEGRTISLDTAGQLHLDETAVTMESLSEEMKMLGAASPDVTIYVRADQDLEYGKVVELMQMLHGAGITRMALVTQPEQQGQ